VSGFGSYVTLPALQNLVVLTLHGSAAQVGWLNAARWLPSLIAGVVVGAPVDRHARRPIMITADLVQAVLLAAIPLRPASACRRQDCVPRVHRSRSPLSPGLAKNAPASGPERRERQQTTARRAG
jgi:MFS transporter